MRTTIIAAAVIAATLLAPQQISAKPDPGPNPSIATFEGSLIDLRQGWDEATACATDGIETHCFRTEAELDTYLTTPSAPNSLQAQVAGDVGVASTCSTNVRLYANPFFGGSVLAIGTRFAVVNLSTWAFSNVTSSYQIGACPATFYDGANAGPPVYPGGTLAGASATVMWSGWDNRVSSLYIS